MSSSSDNPFVRFTAFWWALGVFSLFGVLLLVTKLFTSNTEESNPLEEAAAAKRYETRGAVDAAQSAALGYKEVEKGKIVQVPPSVAFEHVGKALLASKPGAVTQDTQIVPGGIVEEQKKNQKGVDPAEVNKLTPAADTPIDPAVMEAGKAGFMLCMACHGMNGEGGPVGPPLAKNEWVTGPVSNLISIQFRGLNGPVHIGGKEYNFPVGMVPVIATQDDAAIAAVLTYARNSFGNKAPAVLPEQVKMLRASELGKPPLTEADLIKPTP
jgi:mono/diheme cytochrome c family protein